MAKQAEALAAGSERRAAWPASGGLAGFSIALPLAYEPVLLGGLVGAGAAIRLRDLASVPSWTDEVREILIRLDIASGRALPLTNVYAYIGALWNYLLAASFLVFGLRPEVPRMIAVAFGLCTIVATYLLGRRLGGPLVGGIAGGLRPSRVHTS